jgi:hypothetical protein
MESADIGSIELLDMQGKVVKRYMDQTQIKEGYTAYTYSVAGLAAGTYSLVIKTTQQVLTKKIVVVH